MTRSIGQLGRVGIELLSRAQSWSRTSLARQSAAIASTSSAAYSSTSTSTTGQLSRNRFLPSKSPETGRWRPAMPLRHQSRIFEEAYRKGTMDDLPEGPKKTKLQARIQRSQSPLSSTQAITQLPMNLEPSSQATEVAKAMRKAHRVEQQREIIRWLVAQKGPYMGKVRARATGLKRFFKGSKVERNRPKKEKQIKESLEGMEDRVQEWRKVSCARIGDRGVSLGDLSVEHDLLTDTLPSSSS